MTFAIYLSGWTLATSNNHLVISAEQICVRDVCKPLNRSEAASVDDSGLWKMDDVEIRWLTSNSALVRIKSEPWLPATLSRDPQSSPPWGDEFHFQPAWKHGVLPGTWLKGAYDCVDGIEAWLYRPLPHGAPSILVRHGVDGAWIFSTGSSAKCTGPDGPFLGISPTKK